MHTRLIIILAGQLVVACGLAALFMYLAYRRLPPANSVDADSRLSGRRLLYKVLGSFCIVSGVLFAKDTITRQAAIESLLRVSEPLAWNTFQCVEGRFRVLMPGEPKYVRKESEPGAAPVAVHGYSVYRRSRYFLVMYLDLAPGAMNRDVSEVIDSAVQKRFASIGRVVLQKRPVSISGRVGAEFSMDVPPSSPPGEGHCDGRIVLDGQRLYQMFAFSAKGEDLATHRTFLDSFEITGSK